jgi:hypothetical protein
MSIGLQKEVLAAAHPRVETAKDTTNTSKNGMVGILCVTLRGGACMSGMEEEIGDEEIQESPTLMLLLSPKGSSFLPPCLSRLLRLTN